MSIIGGISFPLEVGNVDPDCTICHEELQWPVFCPRCRQGTCFECLEQWFRQKTECPSCRYLFQLSQAQGLRAKYGCPQDGRLIEFYCEQCLECFCAKCRANTGGIHYRHAVRSVDLLRKDVVESVNKLVVKHAQDDKAQQTMTKLKSLMPTGSVFELVRQRRTFQSELDRFRSVTLLANSFESKFLLTNVYGEMQVFTANDPQGNGWELTVYPNGFSDAKGKFISLYLRLLRGKPGRYEYKFQILENTGLKPFEAYTAVDDFSVGSLSLACQRLVHLNEARQHCLAVGKRGYNMTFSTKLLSPVYGLECAAALARNKPQRLDYRKFMWTVRNFTAKKAANKIEFSTVMYDHQKISWRFRIDCNGHWEQDQYVSVFLELLNGAEGWFDIYLKLFHPTNPVVEHKRELTHKFTVHSNWGVPHFVSHMDLYRYLCNDELRFEFGMRPAHFDREI
uniref:Putative e3 ubiquitin ligase n=1 Tax=Aedes albopictus TaxID=7160 RepID=A0A023ETK2_AEDAL